jgi:three-Cys-motif partner protein
MSTHQGASPIVTPMKQGNFAGIVEMRLIQHSRRLASGECSQLTIADPFSGDGENTIEGLAIDGSPLSILTGLERAFVKCPDLRAVSANIKIRLSDLRKDSIHEAAKRIVAKFDKQFDLYGVNHYTTMVDIDRMLAAEAVARLIEWLGEDSKRRLILIIDPNGPKTLPYLLVQQLLTGTLRRQADIVIHISANAISRVLAWQQAQINMKEWFGTFPSMFIHALGADSSAWIRMPLVGDKSRWTIMAYWGDLAPRSDWRKQGFVHLGSPEGQAAVEFYANHFEGNAAGFYANLSKERIA